jgi:lipopolysaccharide export system permease protein
MGGSRVTQIISAKKGHIIEKKNSKGEYEKSIRLKEGFILEWNEKKDGFTFTNFINGEMDYNVPTSKDTKVIGIHIKPETFSYPDLIMVRNSIATEGLEKIPGLEIIKEWGLEIKGIVGLKQFVETMKYDLVKCATTKCVSDLELNNRFAVFSQLVDLQKHADKKLTEFNVEIQKRVAGPVSCQIFFFLSLPLGIVVKRSGKGISFALAVMFLILYYGLFIFGTGISYKSEIPDWFGPWIANIVLTIISIYIMFTRTDINPKETFFGKLYYKIKNKISPYYLKFLERLSPVKKLFLKAKSIIMPYVEKPLGAVIEFINKKKKSTST